MLRTVMPVAIITALALSPAAPAAWQNPPAQQQEKPQEPKPAPASPAGKWDVSLQTDQGSFPSTLDLKVEDKKVTGTMASERGTTAIEGEYAEGKLVFWLTIEGGSGSMTINFTGALQQDGTMTGTADVQGYSMSWKATRVKGI